MRQTRRRPCMFAPCACGAPIGGISRRGFLTGGGAALTLAPRFIAEAVAQTPATRIDVHHHVSAPNWLDSMKSMKKANAPLLNWSAQRSIDDMDKAGVATAMTLSLIHISEPTRRTPISYAVFCLK